jgi:hypothetical protein
MADRSAGLATSTLRLALEAQVLAVGLRQVARELSLHPSSLVNLLRGGQPRSATRQRLVKWYLAKAAEGQISIDPEAASDAADVLLAGVAAEHREEAKRHLWASLRAIYAKSAANLPTWIADEAFGILPGGTSSGAGRETSPAE